MNEQYLKFIYDCIDKDRMVKFYKSKQWRSKRQEALIRDRFECQYCKNGKNTRGYKGYTKAQMVHHIKHVRDYPELSLDINNLVSLCNPCHEEQHIEERHRFKQKEKFMNDERW